MSKHKTVRQLRQAIKRLTPDKPIDNPNVWYKSQHEHWLGWLAHYDEPGAYGRKTDKLRDAQYAYNHIVCTGMLTYLIEAAGVSLELISEAHNEITKHKTLMAKSAALRRIIPWEVIEQNLWLNEKQTFVKRFSHLVGFPRK